MKKVGIVLVNYNGKKYLPDCLNSIENQDYEELMTVVVDNCSKDDSVAFIKGSYSKVELISLDENKGFAGGSNIGIKYAIEAGCEWIMLLNTDTVIETNMISQLLLYADERTVVAPRMYREVQKDGKEILWYAGGKIDYQTDEIQQLIYETETNKDKNMTPKEVDFITGCCILIHKSIFEQIGYLPEEYFLYYEDTDFCVKLKENGIKMLYVPSAGLWHRVGGSAGGEISCVSQYYDTRNKLYFINKYAHLFKTSTLELFREGLMKREYMTNDYLYNPYIIAGVEDFLRKYTGKGYYGKMLLEKCYWLKEGVHELESTETENWNWAKQRRVKILIANPKKSFVIYEISFGLSPAPGILQQTARIYMDDRYSQSVDMPQIVSLTVEMQPDQTMELEIEIDDIPERDPELQDPRKLFFRISDFMVTNK